MTASPSGSSGTPGETATWEGLWQGSPHVPHHHLDEALRQRMEYPRTLVPAPEGLRQPVVFDPALVHFASAYRGGEPYFSDDASAQAWRRARRTALDVVLASVANGRWADHLVLRGSALMATWFGDVAREPGDLDFVVDPPGWALGEPRTTQLFEEVARDAGDLSGGADVTVRIDAAGAVTEDIWTYDRVPGRRLLLPWTADGVPCGTVQLDFVFNEVLPVPGDFTDLQAMGDGPGCRLRATTPELSLAWKLLWLLTDSHPQGKDLYDAALLAERTPLPYEVVREVLVLAGVEALRPCGSWWTEELAAAGETGWLHFTGEYPWVTESFHHCLARLERALRPVVVATERPDEGGYERWARWLRPLIDRTSARNPLNPAAALGHLEDGGRDGLLAAVVVVREILGRDRTDLEEALRTVLARSNGWQFWRGREGEWADLLDELC